MPHVVKPPQSVKMIVKQVFLVLSLTAALALSGCSRQQSDWEKTRTANTADAYELFLKKYPSGEFTAQAKAQLKGLYEERDWQKGLFEAISRRQMDRRSANSRREFHAGFRAFEHHPGGH
jgi:hypothetical protein